jgi:hypothetical protein
MFLVLMDPPAEQVHIPPGRANPRAWESLRGFPQSKLTIADLHIRLRDVLGTSVWMADKMFWTAMVSSVGHEPPYDLTRIDHEYQRYVLGRVDKVSLIFQRPRMNLESLHRLMS